MWLKLFLILACLHAARSESQSLCQKCSCRMLVTEDVPALQAQCSHRKITKIPFNLGEIYHLDVSFNNISALEQTTRKPSENLREFKCSYNRITSISGKFFKSMPNLLVLDLNHNQLEVLSENVFADLNKLTTLDLSFNWLTTIPEFVKPLRSLLEFDLSYNNVSTALTSLKTIFDTGLPEDVEKLTLNRVGFTQIPGGYFEGGTNLKHLSLADNDIKEIPRIPYSVLHLDLSGNNFAEITAKDLYYHSLQTLKLNRLKNLKSIHHYAFYNLQSLEELSLENCPRLKEQSDLAFEYIENDVDLPLKKLSLAGCGLQSLNRTYFHLFTKLQKLDLQNNPWKCSCDISWFQLIQKSKLENPENIRCASPYQHIRRSITDMDMDLKCVPGGYSKLQRMVLPIMCLLVALLVALTVYLIYLNPFSQKNHAGMSVGPQSPYQPVILGDNY